MQSYLIPKQLVDNAVARDLSNTILLLGPIDISFNWTNFFSTELLQTNLARKSRKNDSVTFDLFSSWLYIGYPSNVYKIRRADKP